MTPGQVTDWERRYQPANRLIWRGRIDNPKIPSRLHEITECIDLREDPKLEPGPHTYALIGFACDEGVRRNLGRIGAEKGPDACKQSMANVPLGTTDDLRLYDLGSVACWDGDLESAQASLGHVVSKTLEKGIKPVVIGGGHETAWGHFQGIAHAHPGKRIGILNVDAHFDLRPLLEDRQGTSGTSFTQMAHYCHQQELPFDYTVIGLQERGNTQLLFDTARKLNVQTVTAQELALNGPQAAAEAIAGAVERNDLLYLTICLDAFSASVAPGVSAPQPLGLSPHTVQPLIEQLAKSDKVAGFDVCELSPPHDRDGVTAQLAAALVATYLQP